MRMFFLCYFDVFIINCSEGFDELYVGDIVFVNVVEIFGGGYDDLISVVVGGFCFVLLFLLFFVVDLCFMLFLVFLLVVLLLIKFKDYLFICWILNRICDDKVYCCFEGDRDV